MKAYFAEMERCSARLLEAFCVGFGLPAGALHPFFEVRRGWGVCKFAWLLLSARRLGCLAPMWHTLHRAAPTVHGCMLRTACCCTLP